MKIELRLVIEYDLSDYDDESEALSEVQDVLHQSITRLVGNGGLSDDLRATVDTWEVHTDVVED